MRKAGPVLRPPEQVRCHRDHLAFQLLSSPEHGLTSDVSNPASSHSGLKGDVVRTPVLQLYLVVSDSQFLAQYLTKYGIETGPSVRQSGK